jgi:hypothetical protein
MAAHVVVQVDKRALQFVSLRTKTRHAIIERVELSGGI